MCSSDLELLEFARKNQLSALRCLLDLDRRGLSCVFDDDSDPRAAIVPERAATLVLPLLTPVDTIPLIAIQVLALHATVRTPQHPHQNMPAARELG